MFDTSFGRVGIGICWDQWFPETARCLALLGADIILYPTAIGSEPILDVDSVGHWQRTMQGHAAANIIPVAAANRTGLEEVLPCEANAEQKSALFFYGSSFLTDETGEILSGAERDTEKVIYAEYDSEPKELVFVLSDLPKAGKSFKVRIQDEAGNAKTFEITVPAVPTEE